jgi:hypothetical protein
MSGPVVFLQCASTGSGAALRVAPSDAAFARLGTNFQRAILNFMCEKINVTSAGASTTESSRHNAISRRRVRRMRQPIGLHQL